MRSQFFGALDMKRRLAGCAASLDQLSRVIAMVSANDNDCVSDGDQFAQRELSFFGRTTNRINETHFTVRAKLLNLPHQRPDVIYRLGRLRDHSIAVSQRKLRQVD